MFGESFEDNFRWDHLNAIESTPQLLDLVDQLPSLTIWSIVQLHQGSISSTLNQNNQRLFHFHFVDQMVWGTVICTGDEKRRTLGTKSHLCNQSKTEPWTSGEVRFDRKIMQSCIALMRTLYFDSLMKTKIFASYSQPFDCYWFTCHKK